MSATDRKRGASLATPPCRLHSALSGPHALVTIGGICSLSFAAGPGASAPQPPSVCPRPDPAPIAGAATTNCAAKMIPNTVLMLVPRTGSSHGRHCLSYTVSEIDSKVWLQS